MNHTVVSDALKPKTEDLRDHTVGGLFTLPAIKDLPEEFVVSLPELLDQGFNTYDCASAASGALTEIHEGKKLAWKWLHAVAKSIEGGDIDYSGIQLRTVAKVLCKYGVPELADLPAGFMDQPQEFLNRIDNWPKELFDKALKHKQGSFFDMTGVYDHFDTIRATMYMLRNEMDGALLGTLWGWSLTQAIMDTVPQGGSGHALAGIGWKQKDGIEYIYIQNSYGPDAGENGRHYFSREVINKSVDIYGAIGFHPMSKEDAQELIRKNQLEQLSLLEKICLLLK